MYILALNNIFTNEESTIGITRQPMVTLSTIGTADMCKKDMEGKRMGNRIMAIQFIIDYELLLRRDYFSTFSYLDTSNIKIHLERFSIKLKANEKYSKLKHKMKNITFSLEDEKTFGFKIDIGDINYKRCRGKTITKSQLVSIYSENNDVITEDSISKVVDEFKQMFGIQDSNDTEKYGYRFKVEIKGFDDQPSIFIYSGMFKVVYQASSTELNFESVDMENYHTKTRQKVRIDS